jgi:hypothetical protein
MASSVGYFGESAIPFYPMLWPPFYILVHVLLISYAPDRLIVSGVSSIFQSQVQIWYRVGKDLKKLNQ